MASIIMITIMGVYRFNNYEVFPVKKQQYGIYNFALSTSKQSISYLHNFRRHCLCFIKRYFFSLIQLGKRFILKFDDTVPVPTPSPLQKSFYAVQCNTNRKLLDEKFYNIQDTINEFCKSIEIRSECLPCPNIAQSETKSTFLFRKGTDKFQSNVKFVYEKSNKNYLLENNLNFVVDLPFETNFSCHIGTCKQTAMFLEDINKHAKSIKCLRTLTHPCVLIYIKNPSQQKIIVLFTVKTKKININDSCNNSLKSKLFGLEKNHNCIRRINKDIVLTHYQYGASNFYNYSKKIKILFAAVTALPVSRLASLINDLYKIHLLRVTLCISVGKIRLLRVGVHMYPRAFFISVAKTTFT